MQVKIFLGADLYLGKPVLRVDYYKSEAAYQNPLEHPGEVFNCCSIIEIPISKYHRKLSKLLEITEISINQLLNHANHVS
jgi:hypothetical protein